MRLPILFATVICGFGLFLTGAKEAPSPDKLQAERLRCEYRTEPLGVDTPSPELSWIVTSNERGQKQTAYRVLVASSPELLADDQADLWDSGKIDCDATFGIQYAGPPLESHQTCYWKVKVWDRRGQEGPWSKPAFWSMGIMDPSEWQGDWIGYDALRQENSNPPAAPLHGARWICHTDDDEGQAPAELRAYLAVWDLPADIDPRRAKLAVCADDTSIVLINGIEVARTQDTFQPETEEVAAYLRGGRNTVRVLCRNNSPGYTGICAKICLVTEDERQFVLTTDDHWYCLPAEEESWTILSFENAPNAHVQGPFGVAPWGLPPVRRDVSAPPSYLRGTFSLEKPVQRATVYLAALGWVDLTLNGQRVNDDYFSSGWTDYRRRVYYRTYEVTNAVAQGENVWGGVLTDGWYAGHIGWNTGRDFFGSKPRFRAMMRVEYQDGTSDVFATDRNWTVTKGPITLADILIGEEYDATAENPGWDEPGEPPVEIGSVDIGADVSPEIEWHPGPPVVEVGEFPARSMNQPVRGVYVFDLGQNIAGVARIRVRGQRGQRVQVRYAERLNPDGTMYTANLRLARAIDYYTCKGEGEEVWQPRQSFHGFQYVELSGMDEPPELDAVTGIALSSDTPLASEFDCSDPNLNRLYQNVLWTQRANFIDIPTDCPQRDERLGWTGDAQVYVRTATRVADVQSFFRKWLVDLVDAQRNDGQFPRVAPVMPGEEDGGPAWADAGVICPWEIYQAYGDRELLERQYPSMVRFVEFCRTRSKDEVLPPDEFHAFGDWLSVGADTPREIIYMAYYARSVDLLARSAQVLGREKEAQEYGDLFERIKAAFVATYVEDDGRIHGNTQCAYVLAIAYGLVDGQLGEQAAEHLVADIEGRGWKLSTGFVGTKDLMDALSQIGRSDVALRLLHQQEFPGWMFSIAQGATSIWERWDGWTPENGFQNPGMNSFAHYSFGAVYGWMVENLGGIRTAEPGFGEIVISPVFDPSLDRCRVKYDTIRGPVTSEWQVASGHRELRVEVPANTTATLHLMGAHTDHVKVDGRPLMASDLVCHEETAHNSSTATVVKLPSGSYKFSMPE